jgi:hypothetical protein
MSEAEKYLEYARECVWSADHADTPETRDKLFDVARVWMDAAMTSKRRWHLSDVHPNIPGVIRQTPRRDGLQTLLQAANNVAQCRFLDFFRRFCR